MQAQSPQPNSYRLTVDHNQPAMRERERIRCVSEEPHYEARRSQWMRDIALVADHEPCFFSAIGELASARRVGGPG